MRVSVQTILVFRERRGETRHREDLRGPVLRLDSLLKEIGCRAELEMEERFTGLNLLPGVPRVSRERITPLL